MTKTPKIIGITGNIATGKSVVGRMLANSGGFQIDADMVAHRMLYPSGPAYQAVLETFGETILNEKGLISRQKLGEIVFSDSVQLRKLESLIHPAVTTCIQRRIEISKQPFVIIEAIKLLESDLVKMCDAIWVSDASVETQMKRLMENRHLTQEAASLLIDSQPPQSEKLQQADVVIYTEGSFKHTWKQIQDALNDTIQIDEISMDNKSGQWTCPEANALSELKFTAFWESRAEQEMMDLYFSLGSKILLPFIRKESLKGLLLWENWNFTAAPSYWVTKKKAKITEKFLFSAFENQALKQQAELVLFSKQTILDKNFNPDEFGFEHKKIDDLPYPAWQEAALKIVDEHNQNVWVKYLKEPIEASDDWNDLRAINK